MATRHRSVSSDSYSSYTSYTDSEDERYYDNAGTYGTAYTQGNVYTQGTTDYLPTQVVGTGSYIPTEYVSTTQTLPTQVISTSNTLPTQVIGTGHNIHYNEVTTANVDINHSQKPLYSNVISNPVVQTVETFTSGPTSVGHTALVGGPTVISKSSVVGVNTVPLMTENVALAHAGPEERLKGRGSRLRNKLRIGRKNKMVTPVIDPVTGLAVGVGAMELVDRSKFNGYGPVDQLDQKLAGRNAIDNAIATTKDDPKYNVGGYPAVESYRQNPENIMRHKFTGQTHFDTENASTGPGFTNGDFYDKPGYAGTKYGQAKHQGPIDALAQKIVGHHYTTHEPMMDKIYVEPHQKGPIDALAHKLVGGHHTVIADGVGTTSIGSTVVGSTIHDPNMVGGYKPTAMQRIKNKMHRHHRHKKSGVIAGEPYFVEDHNRGRLPKEMAEGPLDALGHRLTFSLHDPLHTKTAGLGLHNEIVPAGVVNAGLTSGVTTTQTTTIVKEEHVGMMQKLKNKLHIE